MTFVARAVLKPNRMLGLAAVMGLSVMAAACGSGSSGAKVAQVGTTSGPKGSGSEGSSNGGIEIGPDPNSNVNPNSPQLKAAENSCQHLLPGSGGGSTGRGDDGE